MKKRAISWILTLAFCLSMLPISALAVDSEYIYPDEADASGNIIASSDFSRSGPICENTDGDATFNGGTFYIIQGNVTIGGNLTIGGDAYGGLVLCKGATLTVEGALIRTSNNEYYIYGQSDKGENAGRLIIKNSKDNGAAIRSTNSTAPQLRMSSGELEIYGGKSGKLVDNVKLYSTYKSSSIHKGTLDGEEVSPSEWEKTSVDGQKLVIEYCKHDGDFTYTRDGDAQHKRTCKQCGFVFPVEDCNFNGAGGYAQGDANGHYAKCECGNTATTATAHTMETTWTDDGLEHTSMCTICGYAPADGKAAQHTYDSQTGECNVCHFKPVAGVPKDNKTNLYASVDEALEEAATHDDLTVELETKGTYNEDKTIDSYGSFNYADKSVALVMNGYSLKNNRKPIIEVENGTLTVTGDATLVQNGNTHDLANPAVRVTGGKLVFTGKLTATGGSGKYAVEVTGGELTLKAGDVLNGGVSVVGSDNYNSVNALLGEKLAFATQDGDITTIVNGNGKSISGNLTVVEHEHIYTDGKCACGAECPHSSIDDATGKCAACEKTFLAVVNDTRFSTSMASAISFWVTKGGTMKLYADAGLNAVNFTAASADKAYTIDLNGHRINYTDHDGKSTEIHLNGVNLTIQDTKQSSNGAFGPIVADSGNLTLYNGTLKGLTVPADSKATVSLQGGKVSAINSAKPLYTLMPNGYALMTSGLTVDPTLISNGGTTTYTIKNTWTQFISGEKSGSTAFGSPTIPFALRLTTKDSEVGKMSFKWYRIDSTGKAVELAGFTEDETPVEGVYTFNPDHVKINADGWNGMTADNTYNVICVVAGKTSNAAYCWQTALGGYELTVDKASIANADVTFADDPTYDGTQKSPTVTTVTLGGSELTEGTDYTVSGNTQTNAGNYTLKITGKGNYDGEKTAKWSIAPKKVENAAVNVIGGSFTYTGKEITPEVTVMDGATVIPANEFTVSYGNNINAGDAATVTIKNKDGGNYTISDAGTTFTINQAGAPTAPKRGSLTVVNNHAKTYTVNLAALLPELNYGDRIEYVIVSDSMGTLGNYYTEGASVSDGILTLPINAVNTDRTNKIGTITVEVFSTNYQKIELSIDVSATNKILPLGTPTLSKTAITYGEALNSITLSGTMKDGDKDVAGTFAWSSGDVKPDAGKCHATWIFTPEDTEKYVTTSGDAEITVNKATPTGAPKYTLITTSGKTLEDANLTLVDSTLKPQGGSIVWLDENGNYLGNETKVEANKAYKWQFTPSDKNYTTLTGSIVLYSVSTGGGSSSGGGGGGSSTPTYSVNASAKAENGSITVNTKNAAKGSTVTITVKPDSGYVLAALTVTDKDGKKLTVTDKGSGKYAFTMPAGKVDIKAEFAEQAESSSFDDVAADDYFRDAVQWAQDKGITGGIGGGLFGPHRSCTRAQIVTFLWRAAGSPEPKTQSGFSDIAAGSYYAKAAAWAIENGITNGVSADAFAPDAPCTRAQSMAFLYRAMGKQTDGKTAFTDVPAGSYYESAVAWAVANGITNGTSADAFSPDKICTRAQIVTFLYRLNGGK